MTKKHFIALAKALRDDRAWYDGEVYGDMEPWKRGCYDQWHTMALAIADVCSSTNPLFDRVRFLTACGMQS